MSTWNKLAYTDRHPITKLYRFYRNTGLKEDLSVSNKVLNKDTGALTPIPFVVDATYPSVTSLESNDVNMITYKNRVIDDVVLLADGGRLKVYNGTDVRLVTAHAPSDPEKADPGLNDLASLNTFRAIAIKKNRVFAAAHPYVKNRISFCHHDETLGYAVYDYWPAAFFFDVAVEDNDEIVQLKVFRDALIIFCKRSVWALFGDGRTINDYQLTRINVPKGCFSPKSVHAVGNDLFYMADDHVYRLYSTEENYISANIVSEQIEKTLKGISRTDKEKSVSTFHDNKYYLSFPSGVCLVYDILLGAWTKWTNVQANSFIVKEGVLYFSSNNGYINEFKENVYSDEGKPIPFIMKSKLLDFGMEVQAKKLRRAWVVSKQYDNAQSSFDLSALIDHYNVVNLVDNQQDISTNVAASWDESLWDDDVWDFADVVQTELRVRQRAKNMQIIISNDKFNEPVTIYGLVFQYKIKKP